MKLYVGGAFQGKLAYALEQNPCEASGHRVFEGERDTLDLQNMKQFTIFHDTHMIVRRAKEQGVDVYRLFDALQESNPNIIIIGNEVGNGVIPLDKEEREWREETGRVMCYLAKKADCVERVFCGIGMRLKG